MDIPLLPDIVAIFCLSIGVLLVCHQVKIPPIVGFLLTGVLCGPTALGLVQNPHAGRTAGGDRRGPAAVLHRP